MHDIMQHLRAQVRAAPRRILFPEAADERIRAAAARVGAEGLATPVLLGRADDVRTAAGTRALEFIDPRDGGLLQEYADAYAARRRVSVRVARRLMRHELFFGAMHVGAGRADGMVAGAVHPTARVLMAADAGIGRETEAPPSSFFIMAPRTPAAANEVVLFADCAVNTAPDAHTLARIAVATARSARALLGITPRVALLSFSTKGSASDETTQKVAAATAEARRLAPRLALDGELQGDAALAADIARRKAPGSAVAGRANVLIFPDLNAGNIAYKLVRHFGRMRAIGPVLQGFRKPVNDLSRGASVDDIVDVAAVTAAQAATRETPGE